MNCKKKELETYPIFVKNHNDFFEKKLLISLIILLQSVFRQVWNKFILTQWRFLSVCLPHTFRCYIYRYYVAHLLPGIKNFVFNVSTIMKRMLRVQCIITNSYIFFKIIKDYVHYEMYTFSSPWKTHISW